MIGKLQLPVSLSWLWPVMMCALLVSCGDDDDYHYPSVKLEFLTAQAGADGHLKSVLTDEGKEYAVLADASNTLIDANASIRIVSNYSTETTNGTSGVKLYALLQAISYTPKPAEKFENGVKRDPADVSSIWMGLNYLNMILDIKAQNGKHTFRFVEEQVTTNESTGHRTVHLSLYHDDGGDVQAFSRRAYVSIPLRHYAEVGINKITVHFSLQTYSGEKTYEFEYNPQ